MTARMYYLFYFLLSGVWYRGHRLLLRSVQNSSFMGTERSSLPCPELVSGLFQGRNPFICWNNWQRMNLIFKVDN
jgi:hypothetical protein